MDKNIVANKHLITILKITYYIQTLSVRKRIKDCKTKSFNNLRLSLDPNQLAVNIALELVNSVNFGQRADAKL